MQVNITLFSEKRQGTFIRGGAFLRINTVYWEKIRKLFYQNRKNASVSGEGLLLASSNMHLETFDTWLRIRHFSLKWNWKSTLSVVSFLNIGTEVSEQSVRPRSDCTRRLFAIPSPLYQNIILGIVKSVCSKCRIITIFHSSLCSCLNIHRNLDARLYISLSTYSYCFL